MTCTTSQLSFIKSHFDQFASRPFGIDSLWCHSVVMTSSESMMDIFFFFKVKPLTEDQEQLINKLVYYQQEFESPTEADLCKITQFPLGNSEEDNERRFQHITEITILTVQLIVEFSKRVPGFDSLLREDQITLLKVRF